MKEAADKFGVSKKTIARAVKKNNIKSRIPHIEAEYDSEQLTAIFEKPVAGFPYTEDDRCRGIGTDLFFLEEDGLKQKGLDFTQVRSICFTCSNRQPCLDWAYETKEESGMYGGLSANERKQILGKNYDGKFLGALKRDLEKFGVDFTEVLPKKAK